MPEHRGIANEIGKILDIIRSAANTQFDPDVVDAISALYENGAIDLSAA
jgi:HD-GYP domain-containing protein (c-di-GMP phosphodiesterase class II)